VPLTDLVRHDFPSSPPPEPSPEAPAQQYQGDLITSLISTVESAEKKIEAPSRPCRRWREDR